MASKDTLKDPSNSRKAILLKDNNQESIALAHNPVYQAQTKHIDIQHYYICNKVATRQINSNTSQPLG